MIYKKIVSVAVFAAVVFIGASVAEANHAWGSYHWARTANPFTLSLGDNVSSTWDGYLATASGDWSQSVVLDTSVQTGSTKPRLCRPADGRVEVCSDKYGFNGWLGVAQIWINGSHITKGAVKVNDSYFSTATYNTPAWRNMVMCQEIGHTLGLDHQDENFSNANLGTCMDYTNNPSTNQHPNQHDYDMLETIYAHADSFNSVFSSTAVLKGKPASVGQDIDLSEPSAWGKAVREDAQGKNSLYERDLGKGEKVFTFVIWAK